MSKETVKAFYEALKTDSAMAEALAQKTAEQTVNTAVAFAAEKGYAFTAEDLITCETEARELNDGDLEQLPAAAGFSFFTRLRKGYVKDLKKKGLYKPE